MKISNKRKYFYAGKKIVYALFFGMLSQWASALDYPEGGNFAKGSKAWVENCARCHRMRNPTDLRDDQWVTTAFHMRVRAGLTGQETRDIITFLQGSNAKAKPVQGVTTKAGTVSALPTASGKTIYEGSCVACHGVSGKGTLPGVPDFTDKNGPLAKSDSELLSHVITGFQSPGNPMPMPPRGGNSQLSDTDLNASLEYIRKLSLE